MVPQLVAAVLTTRIPDIDPTTVPSDDVKTIWPHCTDTCHGSRNHRACPLLTQFKCANCGRVLAYMVHGLRADIKRRFYAETRITHLWPNFQDDRHIYCVDCAQFKYPNMETTLKLPLLEVWKRRRDFDHICEEVVTQPHFAQFARLENTDRSQNRSTDRSTDRSTPDRSPEPKWNRNGKKSRMV